MPNGVFRAEINKISINIVEFTIYLNNELINKGIISREPIVSDILIEITRYFITKGYIEVEKANTLKIDSSKIKSIKFMSLERFRKEYSNITLDGFPWDINSIEVYLEDTIINGDLDLSKESDFAFDLDIEEKTNLVFLKNLMVNGDIYTNDSDIDRSLRVIGDLTAHNLVIAGADVSVEGKTTIKDVLMLGYSENNYMLNEVNAPVYIVDNIDYHYNAKIRKTRFDYALYYNYNLHNLTQLEGSGYYFKGEKETFLNNIDALISSEIFPFLISEEVIDRLDSLSSDYR